MYLSKVENLAEIAAWSVWASYREYLWRLDGSLGLRAASEPTRAYSMFRWSPPAFS